MNDATPAPPRPSHPSLRETFRFCAICANALVNRCLNKRRQMRCSPRGAQHVLQARVAVVDGRLRDGRLKLTA